MTGTSPTMCYAAHARCGCLVSFIPDLRDLKGAITAATPTWIRKGWTVERIPLEEATQAFVVCDCRERAKAAREAAKHQTEAEAGEEDHLTPPLFEESEESESTDVASVASAVG